MGHYLSSKTSQRLGYQRPFFVEYFFWSEATLENEDSTKFMVGPNPEGKVSTTL